MVNVIDFLDMLNSPVVPYISGFYGTCVNDDDEYYYYYYFIFLFHLILSAIKHTRMAT